MSKGLPRVDIEATHTGDITGAQRLGRRRLLGAGIGGAALSLLPFLSGRVQAASGATTTTEPPRRPTREDTELLLAAQRLELTIRDLYDLAITGVPDWTEAEATVMVNFRESHEEYANQFAALLGSPSGAARSEEIYQRLAEVVVTGKAEALEAGWQLESGAVATYHEMLAELQGINGAALVASIQIAEARHCTVLADLLGTDDLALLLVDEEADPIQVNG